MIVAVILIAIWAVVTGAFIYAIRTNRQTKLTNAQTQELLDRTAATLARTQATLERMKKLG
jgi:hypothetical protein